MPPYVTHVTDHVESNEPIWTRRRHITVGVCAGLLSFRHGHDGPTGCGFERRSRTYLHFIVCVLFYSCCLFFFFFYQKSFPQELYKQSRNFRRNAWSSLLRQRCTSYAQATSTRVVSKFGRMFTSHVNFLFWNLLTMCNTFSQVKIPSLFVDYRIQSNANNQITLTLSSEALLTTLRSACSQSSGSSTISNAEVVMKWVAHRTLLYQLNRNNDQTCEEERPSRP